MFQTLLGTFLATSETKFPPPVQVVMRSSLVWGDISQCLGRLFARNITKNQPAHITPTEFSFNLSLFRL